MKKALLTVSMCLMFCSVGARAGDNVKRDVSVYRVPWVCPAAVQIGCGSHAKPILLELERSPGVTEAWLNRQGTAVAVVWKTDANRKARSDAEKTLKEQKGSRLTGKERTKVLADFESGKNWYRGAEVDRLSEEEAGVIAARWVRRLEAKTSLSKERADGLRDALTDGLRKCLTGKMAMPETDEGKALELRRVAGPFLDDKQIELLGEVAGCGMRAMPNEE